MLKDSWFISNRFSQISQNEKLYTWMYVISILTISLSLVALVSVLTISDSVHESVVKKIASNYPYVEALELKTPIKKNEHIKGANVALRSYVGATKGKKSEAIHLVAIQIKPEYNIDIIEDHKLFMNKNTILLSNQAAEKLGLDLGDRFLLSKGEGYYGRKTDNYIDQVLVTLVGFFKNNYEFDAVIPLQSISEFNSQASWKSLMIVEPNMFEQTEHVESILHLDYGVNKNKITSWYTKAPSLYTAMKLEKVAIYTIFSILLVISSFTIFATIASLGIKRKKDVAILRMLGCRRKQIFLIFIMHGLKIFAISSIIGVTLSFLIITNIDIIFSLIDYITGLNVGDLLNFKKLSEHDFHIKFNSILMFHILCLNLIISVLASLIPSYIIAKMETGDVVKYG